MAAPLKEKEIKRRIKAFEDSKKAVDGGSITLAAQALGNVTKSALSRFLLNQNLSTERVPTYTKDQCKEALKSFFRRHKKTPSREEFQTHSAIGVKWKTHWSKWSDFLQETGVINDPAKILLLDIETAPNRAYFWGKTWNVNINPDWIDADGYVLCWAAKWLGDDEIIFHRIRNKNHRALLDPIHKLLHEAHAVVHYNGSSFDIPTLNNEFLALRFPPPSPYKQVDLLLAIRSGFNFPNNKLNYICKRLDLGEKVKHEGGPQLWLDCMKDKAEAWAKMEEYNRQDVTLLERLYKEILPWLKQHPNRAAMEGSEVCPYCASSDIRQDKTYLAQQMRYIRYQCGDCGGWFRGTKSLNPRGERRFALTA